MTYRKYKLTDDWYRYGKSRSTCYKGPCGVKYYGGLHGARQPWSQSFAKLSAVEKDFITHGAFNVVNPQWKNIESHFLLKQASDFPSAERIFLYDVNRLSDLNGRQVKSRNQENSKILRNFVASLILGRQDTTLFLYARKEGVVYRILPNEERIRKIYSKRKLKKISIFQRLGKISSQLCEGGKNDIITFRKEAEEIFSPWEAVKVAFHTEPAHSHLPRSSGALKMFLDPAAAACESVTKWFIRNNDPRTNVGILKEPHEVSKSCKNKVMSSFFYMAQDGIPDWLKGFLKKKMGFCPVSIREGAVEGKDALVNQNSFHAMMSVQHTIDAYCPAS